ncbi:uncharacterized protein LOC129602430 [Paramacrobiotus metropolitanus]|uniref:uncharacterized protein LOC129602430 n=1 Tax=Paramacrobiotus metropolitanus TaxID=2943436 RepID=UPI002445974F|nr:uncharacterized protein LOC129602430 [Paramacrobiotus metropolitanus]
MSEGAPNSGCGAATIFSSSTSQSTRSSKLERYLALKRRWRTTVANDETFVDKQDHGALPTLGSSVYCGESAGMSKDPEIINLLNMDGQNATEKEGTVQQEHFAASRNDQVISSVDTRRRLSSAINTHGITGIVCQDGTYSGSPTVPPFASVNLTVQEPDIAADRNSSWYHTLQPSVLERREQGCSYDAIKQHADACFLSDERRDSSQQEKPPTVHPLIPPERLPSRMLTTEYHLKRAQQHLRAARIIRERHRQAINRVDPFPPLFSQPQTIINDPHADDGVVRKYKPYSTSQAAPQLDLRVPVAPPPQLVVPADTQQQVSLASFSKPLWCAMSDAETAIYIPTYEDISPPPSLQALNPEPAAGSVVLDELMTGLPDVNLDISVDVLNAELLWLSEDDLQAIFPQ